MVIVVKISDNKLKSKSNKYSFYFSKILSFICMALPLLMMDVVTRLFGHNIDIIGFFDYAPNAFTICWVVLLLNFSTNLKNKIGKKIYLFSNILFLIMFLVQNVYYSTTNTFFNFHLLGSFSEGLPYFLDVIKNCNILVYIAAIVIIFLIVFGYKHIPDNDKNNFPIIVFVSVWCFSIHLITPFALGNPNQKLSHFNWHNLKNNYINFSDSNKSMKISGFFEYTFRDFYITYLKHDEKETPEITEFLNNAFAPYGDYNTEFTGLFKDKNLIFIQLEGIDDWLITEETTPTLYKMMNNSFNFTDHYSYYNGGGSTFNSEFAVNTGFITPLSYIKNAFTFNKNSFPNSMANLFKNEGYVVNAFHMNTGEYYSRTSNYKNWGYDNYYGLIEIQDYEDESYMLDRELILNEKFNKLMFPTDTKFVDYIITYSGHMPFTSSEGVCKLLYEKDNINPGKYVYEENCVKKQAKETDYMVELLLKNLEDKGLLDDTVIVAFTDHYLYTLNNIHILDKYKDTDTNLINHTPFFIWSNDIEPMKIDSVTSQIDILPTVLNLFGLYDNPNNYIGKDALNPDYEGIVFFSDYSWYDGNVYVENGVVKNKKNISDYELNEKNNYISYIAKKNDLALKFNYFK